MELQELLAPVAGEFDIDEALESWRWLIAERVRALVVTAMGDLFVISAESAVLFLDTNQGICERAAASVAEWEQKLGDPALVDSWFKPGVVAQLREAKPLCQGECYSPLHPPILGGDYSLKNWPPVHWRAHFSNSGRMHEAIKDLPDSAVITKWDYTEL